jgi:hypothetical protein
MLKRTGCLLAVAFLITAISLRAQRSTTPQSDAKPSDSTKNAQKGIVQDETYRNPSIGLTFTAPNLHFNLPEMKGTPGTVPLQIMAPASGDPGTGAMAFFADALEYYPEDQRNAASYLQKVVNDHAARGYRHIDGKGSEQLGGTSFARADFAKGFAYETVLVAIHNAYAFQFVFVGSDFEAIDKRIASMDVKITP